MWRVDKYNRYENIVIGAELVYSNLSNVPDPAIPENTMEDARRYDLHWRIATEYTNFYVNCNTGEFWADTNL